MKSELAMVRDIIRDRLKQRADLSGVTILSRQDGNIESAIQETIGRLGVLATVDFVGATIEQHQSRRPYLRARYHVDIGEAVEINAGPGGAQKPALYVAERVVAELHMIELTLTGGRTELLRATDIIEPVEVPPPADYGLTVKLETQIIIPSRI